MVRQPLEARSIIRRALRQGARGNRDSGNPNLPEGERVDLALRDDDILPRLDAVSQEQGLGRAVLREILARQRAPLDGSDAALVAIGKADSLSLAASLLEEAAARANAERPSRLVGDTPTRQVVEATEVYLVCRVGLDRNNCAHLPLPPHRTLLTAMPAVPYDARRVLLDREAGIVPAFP